MTIDCISVDERGITIPSGQLIRCALGPSGIVSDKTEGDGATPAGQFPLRRVLYRSDRVGPPATSLPCLPINRDDGWCDDPRSAVYNRPVKHPFEGSAEHLWRTDHLYDICVILGHNDDPPVPGRGSAIFFHLCHDDYRPTEGCIAVCEADMRTILAVSDPQTMMKISPA